MKKNADRVRSVREEMVCKTEGTWLGEELEEMGHMVHRVVMEKEPSNRHRG